MPKSENSRVYEKGSFVITIIMRLQEGTRSNRNNRKLMLLLSPIIGAIIAHVLDQDLLPAGDENALVASHGFVG